MLLAPELIAPSRVIAVFAVCWLVGFALTLPLFHFNLARLWTSPLMAKIAMWIPLAAVFLIGLYAPAYVGLIIFAALMAATATELSLARLPRGSRIATLCLGLLICLGLISFAALAAAWPAQFPVYLVIIVFSSVMSDVVAFFAGRYLGRHALPRAINAAKSWEGATGQIIGAAIGLTIVAVTIAVPPQWWLWIPLGIGSAAGDMANSYAKRLAHRKDWSKALPGHGGVTDRLSSLSFAAGLTYLVLVALSH